MEAKKKSKTSPESIVREIKRKTRHPLPCIRLFGEARVGVLPEGKGHANHRLRKIMSGPKLLYLSDLPPLK